MTELDDKTYLGHRQRLKARFLSDGGKAMPDYELLELLLTFAIPRRDVKPLAKTLIARFNNFAGVINADLQDLMAVSGVKENTAIMLKMIAQGAKRMAWQQLKAADEAVIADYDAMIDYCRTAIGHRDVEEFRIIFLDTKLQVIGEEVQQRGTINQVSIHPREVIKAAMFRGARAIILVHNHPSGDVTPSHADLDITNKINVAAHAVGIKLFDHLIVSKNGYYSFKDHGLIAELKN